MASSGYLVPPGQDASKQTLWDETWKRVDRFLPELRSDLASETLGVKPSIDKNAKNSGEQGEAEVEADVEVRSQMGTVDDIGNGERGDDN